MSISPPRIDPRLRPAGEVLSEARAALPLSRQGTTAPQRNLLDQIGDTLSQMAGTEKLEKGFSLA